MANQGRSLTPTQILKIKRLLAATDMPIAQIAERMGCSRSSIVALNRKHGIRDYSGRRGRWTVRLLVEVGEDAGDDGLSTNP